MVAALRIVAVAAMAYNAWIIFRVVDDWLGLLAAIGSIIIFPLSIVVMPFIMLFVRSSEAGALALWPALILIGVVDWIARKQGRSLLIK